MPHIRGSACRDASDGDPMVGPGYRRVAKSDGNADRPGQDLDRASRQLGTQGEWHSCVPLGGEEWRMADYVGSRGKAWRLASSDSPPDQGSPSACSASGTLRASSNSIV